MDWSDLVSKFISEIAWRVWTVVIRVISPHAVKAYSCTRPAICVKASALYHYLNLPGWILYLATVGSLAVIAVWDVRGLSPPIWASILPILVLSLGVWDACKAGSRRIRAATAGVKK
jgi:hypothetical protein